MSIETVDVKIKKLDPNALIPAYGTEFSAGADLHACLEEPLEIAAGRSVVIHTGIAVELPEGYAGFVFARSGLASRQGLAPSNKVGVIDSDYRGEIMVSLFNHSDSTACISPGDRIAQMVVMPYVKACWINSEALQDTERGTGGFGSTGH